MTTLNKKSKEIKTIKKTQVEETTISNTERKEDNNYMQGAIKNSFYNMNGHICNYNKKYKQHMEKDKLEDFLEYLKKQPNFNKIKEAYAIVGMVEQKRFELLREEYLKDKAYGQETVHPSELPKKEESNMESQSKQMLQTQKKENAQLRALIRKAVKEAVKEELQKGGE